MNRESRPGGESAVLPELVALQAARTPGAPAVADGTTRLDYATLDAHANQLAHRLRELGVRPDEFVGVCLHREVGLAVALLGVWRSGAAYVPMDPDLPADRLAWLLRDTGARIVLTVTALADTVRAAGAEPVCLDADTRIGSAPGTAPDVDVTGAHAAYAIYTSGSTGRPKGVVVSHAGIANRVGWTVREHGLGATDRVLQKTSLSFDAAGWEVFAPLISGGTVVFAPVGAERDPALLVRTVADQEITVLQVVPSVLRLLVEEPGWQDCHALRLVFSAGEPLHAQDCQKLIERVKVDIWNTYGPTECSIDVTAASVDPAQLTGPISIGRPIDNMRVLVLNEAGELAPIGMPGELHAGGVGVARGYLGRPDLTAERFVPDPYGPPGSRLYRTGDLVRWRPDATLEYLGRVDHQVKVNGVRIEPGEIEAALAAHPEVKAAVVTARSVDPDTPTSPKRLVAYLTCRQSIDADELRRHLRDRLPASLVPAVFVTLDAFPLTTSGKVDRGALPAPESIVDEMRAPFVAPRTPAERAVASAWSDLLDVERVGVYDDFFALGGSSLLLTRLASRLGTALGGQVALRDLFAASTVEAQARLATSDHAAEQPIRPVPRGRALPLSFGQRRLWFLDRMRPGDPEWIAPLFLRLPDDADEACVRRTLATLVDRHESLRTRYQVEDGEPVQVIDPASPIELRVVDDDDLAARCHAEFGRGFDLAGGPVWRALLVRNSSGAAVLLLTMHHIACDGWSAAVLEREFHQLYEAFAEGTEPDLPAPALQYADFAVWQRQRLTEDALDREVAHWRDTLAGSAPVDLPTDRPRPAERDSRGGLVSFTVPAPLARAVTELSRRSGATPFMTLLTGFATMLARYTGQWDVAVGTPMAGRTRPELADVVGCFINPVVLRCDLAPELGFDQALHHVRQRCLTAFEHQDVPFERLVDTLQPERDLSRTPLYQVAFDLHEAGMTGTAADDELLAFTEAWRVEKVDVSLFVRAADDGSMHAAFGYATALFDRSTVDRMIGHYLTLLSAVTATPDVTLSTVDILTDADRAVLSGDRPVAGRPIDRCLPQVFEERVAAAPDAIAVVYEDIELTYGELNARANRLAHHLRGLGVGAESLVGVCLDRGIDLVPALLGVLKAGAAYLPLDPAQPADRMGFMLADARAAAVVTQTSQLDAVTAAYEGPVVVLDEADDVLAAQPAHNPETVTGPDNTIYVIYTSGSTGRPKGVCVTHANVLRLLRVAEADFAFSSDDVWPLFHSYAFDWTVWELWGSLLYGGTLIVVPWAVTRSPDEFLDLLVAEQVTVLNQTPSAFRGLVALAAAGDPRMDELALRAVVFGGEKLEIADLAPWIARFGLDWPALINMYGITETTVHVTYHPVTKADTPAAGNPIGHPLADLSVHLLDEFGNLVPVGVPGEMFVGGAGVARGYLNRPELTAQRFVPDPFSSVPGARLYRSGDLARRRPDGSLDYLGRADHQVKIRGYRIELGEIEAALAAVGEVRDAVVVPREDTSGDQRLVAYLVPVAGAALPPVAELRTALGRSLPDYMVPASFVTLERLPLTANGKLDRKALPAPDESAGPSDADGTPPRNDVERLIAEVWTELLGVESGVHSNFFVLGGHSILAVTLSARLQDEFDVALPVRAIFEHPTIAALAEEIEARVRADVAQLSDSELRDGSMSVEEQEA